MLALIMWLHKFLTMLNTLSLLLKREMGITVPIIPGLNTCSTKTLTNLTSNFPY
jgi:hypothetical protein